MYTFKEDRKKMNKRKGKASFYLKKQWRPGLHHEGSDSNTVGFYQIFEDNKVTFIVTLFFK